ncbi:2-keto-3-deoxygluconate permease [Corynebacterium testudinoris]|uniref:2-keto-3-deoxygluconate permease n=1 Tax=Corynebacterium testudinoris TaxID=136857 RepID=A0A0G3H846_9CORY|nr:2-keto-3-deoxygluconate permease [Corynebacterium testudinoris]AKK09524.1 2-keto-3-deoxygluconate permease [Corynebacterium testudinoris]MBX8996229.1 2-keto-3-deoxygluconate permease [Corynebacterium testudinoris]
MLDSIFRVISRIPGALMIVPLFFGAIINTFIPSILGIGSFTTALFRDGTAVLIGIFFLAVGSQISLKTAAPSLEKGLVLLIAKFSVAAIVGLSVAFFAPNGELWGLLPLAIIAAMSNSNGSLYSALMQQFGSKTDKGAISVLSINDGPFLTMIALGVAGVAQFPVTALFAAIFPMILGFVLGNFSSIARSFLAPGQSLIIPFVAFAIGASIDFSVLLTSGLAGIVLGLVTVVLSGGFAILGVHLWHRARRTPKPARNIISGIAESAVAGNAIATPAAISAIDPSFSVIQGEATAQIAAAVVVTAFITPFLVAFVSRWQVKRGITKEAEDAYFDERGDGRVELGSVVDVSRSSSHGAS